MKLLKMRKLARDIAVGNETKTFRAKVVYTDRDITGIYTKYFFIRFGIHTVYLQRNDGGYYILPFYIHNFHGFKDYQICLYTVGGLGYTVSYEQNRMLLTVNGFKDGEYCEDKIILSIEIRDR
jgi:hypothetical protein